ncbi:TOX high mobility group box family member 4b isoform X1 [Polypterus senegalus]|uniref:TOX high mobility group box family member 4b isoform X1 n=1 Tax=Polypterus senegalus TaxID=55291 RepID=UPI0019645B9D|nr:TOX high mobility group box family member 4b isoform X1 [Polypterus senegalus]
MDLHFYSGLSDGPLAQNETQFLDTSHVFNNGFSSVSKFPGSSDNYLTITGSGHPFLTSAETFHTPSLGDEEFEIPPISLDPDPSLAVTDVVGHFDELRDPAVSGGSTGPDASYSGPFTTQGLDHLTMSGGLIGTTLNMDLGHSIGSQYTSTSPVTIDVPLSDINHSLLGHSQLTTIDQSELSSQLGLSLGGGAILPRPQTPEEQLSATPSPSSSLHEEDSEDFKKVSEKQGLVESPVAVSPSLVGVVATGGSTVVRKAKPPKKSKKKKDPNEPQKPVSAYALFFRDTQAAIKGQNPNATFGEVSKIVASMWDSLGEDQKQVYKRKTEAAKKEYLKALAVYKANQLSQNVEVMDTEPVQPAPSPSPPPPPPPPPPPAPKPAPKRSHSAVSNSNNNTITNICTSNIILNHPQVITRSRTGAIAPQSSNQHSSASSQQTTTPTVAKIIISKQILSGAGRQIPTSMVTVLPATRGLQIQTAPAVTTVSPAPARPLLSQPPPLQQIPPPRLQQMVHPQPPPPLQAKPRGAGLAVTAAAVPPPPLQIKIVPAPVPVQIQAEPAPVAQPPPPPPPLLVSATSCSPPSETLEVTPDGNVSNSSPVVAEVHEEPEELHPEEVEVQLVSGSPPTQEMPSPPTSRCLRDGCPNPAVESKDWDREYCSNECVATHCRDIFITWCSIRGASSTTAVK